MITGGREQDFLARVVCMTVAAAAVMTAAKTVDTVWENGDARRWGVWRWWRNMMQRMGGK